MLLINCRPVLAPRSAGGDFFTTFSATENPISEGGKWVCGGAVGLDWTNPQTSGGRLAATNIELSVPPFNDSIAHLSTAYRTFNANQFAQGTVHRVGGYTQGHEALLLLRFLIAPHVASGYEIYWSTNGGLTLVLWNGPLNDFIPLTSVTPGIASAGDVLWAGITGSAITAKINGSTVLTYSDTTWSTGQPGVGNNPWDTGADFYSYGWEDYRAGDLP